MRVAERRTKPDTDAAGTDAHAQKSGQEADSPQRRFVGHADLLECHLRFRASCLRRRSRVAQAQVCKTFDAGSIPAAASMKNRMLVPTACCALALAACSSSSKKSTPSTTTHPTGVTSPSGALTPDAKALKEVTVTSCGPDAKRNVEIKGTAHNARPGHAQYTVQLRVSDKTGKPLIATAAAASVASGATAPWSADTSAKYIAGMTCTVTSVSRNVA